MSKKNKWRTRGRFQFKRESGRYSDGSLDGRDILFVRIRGVACCYASTSYPDGVVTWTAYNGGLYFKASPVAAARQFRAAMLAKLESTL